MNELRRLRELVLADDIRDLLRNHKALRGCPVDVNVDGGVAHLDGAVASTEERARLRQLIGRVRGINAVWDTLKVGDQQPILLDLGCGRNKQKAQAWGVDLQRFSATTSVQAHIERGLPFADAAVDQIYTVHFLEHVRDLVGVMNEIHRVLKPDGVLHVMVPHWQCINAVADPTHVRFFHAQTFKYFCSEQPGVRPYRPLSIAATAADLFADLQPVKDGDTMTTARELARFFA